MSAVEDLDQDHPVTTTYDAGDRHDLASELHAFCSERAFERVALAGAENDGAAAMQGLRQLRVLDVMYADARRNPGTASRATQFLHTMALKDRDHAAFRPEWGVAPWRGRLRALTTRTGLTRIVF